MVRINYNYRVMNSGDRTIDVRSNRLGRAIKKYKGMKIPHDYSTESFMIVDKRCDSGDDWCRLKATDPNRLGMAHLIYEAMDSIVEGDTESAMALLAWVSNGLKGQHERPSLAGYDKHEKGWTESQCSKANENLTHENVMRWRTDKDGDKTLLPAEGASLEEIKDVVDDAAIHAEFALRCLQQKPDRYYLHEVANDAGKVISLLDYARVALANRID